MRSLFWLFSLLLSFQTGQAQEGRSVCKKGPFCTCSSSQAPSQRTLGTSQEPGFSNLPSFYRKPPEGTVEGLGGGEGKWRAPQKQDSLSSFLKGKEKRFLRALIAQELIVSSGVPQPLQAQVTRGPLQGAQLLGQAERHPEIEDRVLLSFHTLDLPESNKSYPLEAVGMELSGAVGLQGEAFSSTPRVLAGALVSSAGQAVSEASIPQEKNRWGEYVEKPSLSRLGKKAASGALSQMTQYFTEQLGKIPGFVQVNAFQVIRVRIQKTPAREKRERE